MNIVGASHAFSSQHQRLDIQRVSERLSITSPDRREATPSPARPSASGDAPKVADESPGEVQAEQREQLNVQILRSFLERFLGVDFEASVRLDPQDWQADPLEIDSDLAGVAIEFERIEERFEAESLRVDLQASIRLGDGRRLDASLSLAMDRQFYSRNVTRLSSGQRQDPLILNFDGSGASLSSRRVDFDLRADGTLVRMPVPEAGNALLVRDSDGSGVIDDGREVPGAQSGDVWADLRALDSDDNGFIDGKDPEFAKLGLLEFDRDGQAHLSTLAEQGVKAIALDFVTSPFRLTDSANNSLGEIRSTGYFLTENLSMRPAQQVDFFV